MRLTSNAVYVRLKAQSGQPDNTRWTISSIDPRDCDGDTEDLYHATPNPSLPHIVGGTSPSRTTVTDTCT